MTQYILLTSLITLNFRFNKNLSELFQTMNVRLENAIREYSWKKLAVYENKIIKGVKDNNQSAWVLYLKKQENIVFCGLAYCLNTDNLDNLLTYVNIYEFVLNGVLENFQKNIISFKYFLRWYNNDRRKS